MMGLNARLNILLTHGREASASRAGDSIHPWYETLSHLLAPLGVQTFEATTGPQAMAVIESYPIHLAVVDTRLTANDGLALLRILERIRHRALASDSPQPPPAGPAPPLAQRVKVGPSPVEEAADRAHVKVRFAAQSSPPCTVCPAVILVTPQQDAGVLQEALKCNAFSVMNDPVDLNLMLDVMARALRRFHHNQWPL